MFLFNNFFRLEVSGRRTKGVSYAILAPKIVGCSSNEAITSSSLPHFNRPLFRQSGYVTLSLFLIHSFWIFSLIILFLFFLLHESVIELLIFNFVVCLCFFNYFKFIFYYLFLSLTHYTHSLSLLMYLDTFFYWFQSFLLISILNFFTFRFWYFFNIFSFSLLPSVPSK